MLPMSRQKLLHVVISSHATKISLSTQPGKATNAEVPVKRQSVKAVLSRMTCARS